MIAIAFVLFVWVCSVTQVQRLKPDPSPEVWDYRDILVTLPSFLCVLFGTIGIGRWLWKFLP